ncbi:MAG: DegT/DnrJ/EryC1/StrS family aminotransferase [Rhodospirillales bacterium]|nr:DegT/DnrJ/EryC1/StrS family aminotransferase [Rhodospirillales bacterium]
MIPIARPLLDETEAEAARQAVLSGWVTQGPQVAAFEREFAETVNAAHACAVSSCTAALHLALLAVGVRLGDEVVTVSHSFIATANAVRYCGAKPVFVDIDPLTCNLDPDRLQPAITTRTRAILCVHQMGMPCDLARILTIARAHDLPVIEDAACAIGSEVRLAGTWERIGKPHGDIACFSFHPRKILTTGDGGMLTTANPEWDRMFRLWRQHGMDIPDTVRHGAREVSVESYPVLGFNYRMTDIQAAIGRKQLGRLSELVARRRSLARRYRALLADIPGLAPPCEPWWARSNWQSYCVRLPANVDQRAVMQRMLDDGVATRRGIMCAHREPAYAEDAPRFALPASERAQDRRILLPLYAQMTEDEHTRVVEALKDGCGYRRRISACQSGRSPRGACAR